jgi:tetratricopeptide (TPR) repeat protein
VKALAGCLFEKLGTQPIEALAHEVDRDPRTPEILNTLIDLMDRRRIPASKESLAHHCRAYELVSIVGWDDEVDEKEWMLARLAFLAWNQARLIEDIAAANAWQTRCSRHCLSQEHVRNFVAAPLRGRSEELMTRYLSDEAVLLTVLHRFDDHTGGVPADLALECDVLYEWIVSSVADAGQAAELSHYFATAIALTALGAKLGLQHRENVPMWFDRVHEHIGACDGIAPLLAMLEHRRLMDMYLTNASRAALSRIDPLILRFEALGMSLNAVKARFFKAILLKELGHLDRAFMVFAEVEQQTVEHGDLRLQSMAVAYCAQVKGCQGLYSEGFRLAQRAFTIARDSGVAVSVAMVQGTTAELLRDHGDYDAAIRAYSASVATYENNGYSGLAAYTRVLIAETFLLTDRPGEAAEQLLAALPTIESHWLGPEAVAAVGLLRQAIRQQQSDPDALRLLREQLQLMREQGKL